MTRFLLAGAAALGMMTGAALAQTSTTETTTTVVPAYAPPVTIVNGATQGHALEADGDKTRMVGSSTVQNNGAVSTETVNTTKTYPFSNLVTTTEKKTDIVNGVAVDTTKTTQAYPSGMAAAPPVVTTTTSTRPAGMK